MRQRDRQRDRETDRETERQRDRERDRERERECVCHFDSLERERVRRNPGLSEGLPSPPFKPELRGLEVVRRTIIQQGA